MRCPVNCLLVELDKAYQDTITFKSGVKLFVDTTFEPEWKTTCTGKVLSVPATLQNRYDFNGVMDARVGDTVIFSYMVIEDKEQRPDSTDIHRNQFYHEGKYYWKVHMMHVLGYIRDGQLVPAAGKVFLRDIEEVKEDRIGLIWLPEMSKKGRKQNRAEVISVGEAKEGRVKPSLYPGDIAVYNDRYAERYGLGLEFGKIAVVDHQYIAATETVENAA